MIDPRTALARAGRRTVVAGALASVATASIALVNAATAPVVRPRSAESVRAGERITVCIPARDEAQRLPALLRDLLAQQTETDLRVLVLDDGSSDGTAEIARSVVGEDPRFEIVDGRSHADVEGMGKSLACIDLGVRALASTDPTLVVFLDADVRLHPRALDAAAAVLRAHGVALLSPWPEETAVTMVERLVQPLLSWSWSVTLLVSAANRGRRPSMGVANGQFLVIDAAAYRAVGGHDSTRFAVADDLALVRHLRRRGFGTAVAYGGRVATCRMYTTAAQVRAGHAKWLWSQFGGTVGTVAVSAVATAIWVVPPAALTVRGPLRRWGAVGYGAGVVSRFAARRAEGGADSAMRDLLTSAVHPLSVAAGTVLLASSDRGRRQGTLVWKSRVLETKR
ncbi:MAG: glycosyltransferase family A protein [Rhodococcus sp. (in: high G+C Gram-positive bacteria)]